MPDSARKERAVARLLPPDVQTTLGFRMTFWFRSQRSSDGQRRARLQAVMITAVMDEAQRSDWCREQGIFPWDLKSWRSLRRGAQVRRRLAKTANESRSWSGKYGAMTRRSPR
jgi:hypothetical protein